MLRKKKHPKDSLVSMTELVLPNDTNTLNNLMGGRLMHWMDIVSAIAGQKHCRNTVVTASVDNISFREPIRLGDVVTLRARATRAFNSSVEIRIDVEAENIPAYERRNVRLDSINHSSELSSSRVKMVIDEDNRPEIREENSFLHDNVD